MGNFGGPTPFTTWDGEPVSRVRPHGATVVVAARAPGGWRCLLLHRAWRGPAWEGDWAWTPPAGSRKPGEDITACAVRELREETGLDAIPQPVRTSETDWAVFALVVPWGAEIAVDGAEHDRFEWVTVTEARRRCRPAALAESFSIGCAAMHLD